MKRVAVLCAFAALALPASALAHPLGNFTVNRYSEVVLSGDRVYVNYVLDVAEIPAFQERERARDAASYTDRIGRRLELTVAGKSVPLELVDQAVAHPPGAAGLDTLRLQAIFASPRLDVGNGSVRLDYRDRNFPGRIGWKEIVVTGRVLSSTAPRRSISNRLLAYPKDLLQSPPDVTSARASAVLSGTPGPPPKLFSAAELEGRVAVAIPDGGFASLIAEEELSLGFVLLSLLVALFWGAAHAFSPGHGKAIVAGYLIGSRGTPRHAVLLGLIVTATHTIGVFALGLVTLALSEFIVPEDLYPWLNLVSALLVVGVGLAILRWRVRSWRHARAHAHGHHHHHHHHDHSSRSLLGIGVSAGVIPCPTALVVLLAAISLHRVGYGLVLIVAFSLGLAAAVTGIGLVAVTARRAFSRMSFEGPLVSALPAVSALVVLALGLAMTVRALPTLL